VLGLPPLPVKLAEPPLLECEPALALAFTWAFGSMVLLCGSLQPNAIATSSVAKQAVELERRRIFYLT